MRTIIMTILAITLMNAQAFANALWDKGAGWEIRGVYGDFCLLYIAYDSDEALGIASHTNGDNDFFISSRSVALITGGPGSLGQVMFNFGSKKHLHVGSMETNRNMIVPVSSGVVHDFANSVAVDISVRGVSIGLFNLPGTREMVRKLLECTKAMSGQGV